MRIRPYVPKGRGGWDGAFAICAGPFPLIGGLLEKPFRTAEEQVDILESRGLKITDRDDAVRTLLSWNYYTLVNGYKDMFLDPVKSREANDDRYIRGAYFEQLKLAYALDRGFRSVTMDVLMQAESVMKTSLIHAFCQKYGGGDSYLEEGWECGVDFYRGPKEHYVSNLSRLKNTLNKLRGNSRHKDYIQHYIDEYSNVPLWVLAPCLNFGDIAMLFDFQGDAVQNLACANVAKAGGKGQISPRKMREVYQIMTPFRNICAHNERVFCAKVGPRGQYRMKDLFYALGIVLPDKDVYLYAQKIRYYITVIEDEDFLSKVLAGMNMSYEEIDELASKEK